MSSMKKKNIIAGNKALLKGIFILIFSPLQFF